MTTSLTERNAGISESQLTVIWHTDNIDYDDIKIYIKEQTTPGKGKSVSVPGRPDENLQQFEHALFQILRDQHHRIDLFVKSKAGEIRRRLGMFLPANGTSESYQPECLGQIVIDLIPRSLEASTQAAECAHVNTG